jgi:hypothetical protein
MLVPMIVRSALPRLVIAVTLFACTSSAIDERPEPASASSADPPGITLVLEGTRASCCHVFTINPGPTLTVVCTLVVLDPAGRLILTAVVPPKAPGHLRSSGFEAPTGRHGHGVFRLPIDIALDSYTAPCRPAAWHGGAPI